MVLNLAEVEDGGEIPENFLQECKAVVAELGIIGEDFDVIKEVSKRWLKCCKEGVCVCIPLL